MSFRNLLSILNSSIKINICFKSSSSTFITKIFVTLSKCNLQPIINEVFLKDAIVKQLGNQIVKLIIVKEEHKSEGYHYHILIILGKGVSKNTYREDFRSLFYSFEGRGIDVQGVRNLMQTVRYILKCTRKEGVFLFNMDWIIVLELGGLEDLLCLETMKLYDSLEDWKQRSPIRLDMYLKHPKKVKCIWDECQSRRVIPLKEILPVLDSYTFTGLFRVFRRDNLLGYDVVLFLLKLSYVLFSPHKKWKQTNILLRGDPNTGKTTFFVKFEKVFSVNLF
jgi:hypothetical protein